jgi:hypothetical protein
MLRANASATSASRFFAAAKVAALVAERDAHLRQRVLRLARAWRGLRRTTGEALQRHVERLLLEAGCLGGKPQLLQRLHADPDLVGGLADRIRRRDGSIDQGSEAAHRGHSSERHAERPDTGAQQLRLAAEAFQPARGALARALDPLQALLAALADRNELGLDLSDTVDRQADGIGVRASGHRSVCVLRSGTCERGACRRSRGQTAVSGASSLRTSGQPGPMVRTSQVRPIAIQREKASNSEDRSLRNHYSQA